MDIFEELDNDKKLILSKNMSTRGFMNKGKISIEDIDYYQKKVRITSPRSIASMNKLGVNDKDLEYLPFKDYLLKTPELIPQNKEMQRKIYNYVENIRRARIDQIKQLRNEIPEEEAISTKKRCFSSKFREQNTFLNNSINNKKLSSTFLEKDIKAFNRMRNINKTELFNRMQIELKKELMKIINEEKEQRENELFRRQQKLLNKKMKIENYQKLKKEEEKAQQDKEMAKLERKKEEKRIDNLIRKSSIEEQILKNKILEERMRRDKNEYEQNEFREKIKRQREEEHQILLQKEKENEERAKSYQKELENKRNKLNRSKKKKMKAKRDIVERNLKRMEYELELKRIIYEENERKKNEQKLKEDERHKNEIKKIELIKQKKLLEYNDNQNFFSKKNNYIYQMNDKYDGLNEREKKQKETLFKNELLLNQRKEDIMNKINQKQKNLKKAQEEKNKKNLLEQQKKFQKKINKEYKVKQIAQLLENKKNEIREQLNEKDKRVEEFMHKKNRLVKKKRNMFDEITKEKQLDNEKFERMLNKKNIDKNILNSIKEMFPDNKQIDNYIGEFNEYLDKNGKNKLNNNNAI